MITTIIESYLRAIDQATFQKLMNHLLILEGYSFIASPGATIGRNKTRPGTPDSFFQDDDNYIFCEYTTKEKIRNGSSFFAKLKEDIDHCFNHAETNIPNDKISLVILAFTERIDPGEFNQLTNQLKKHNPTADLKIYSIQELPFRICYFPGFAEKYIAGVNTSKGTIYTLPDFLQMSLRGLQPSLTNPFIEREDEIAKARLLLSQSDILVLSGHQGVGKSKFAVQLSINLQQEGFEPRVIVSSPVPLWDDLRNYIHPEKKYVILFDDGNKALPNLSYLLQFMQ